jgi:hypothetical protein
MRKSMRQCAQGKPGIKRNANNAPVLFLLALSVLAWTATAIAFPGPPLPRLNLSPYLSSRLSWPATAVVSSALQNASGGTPEISKWFEKIRLSGSLAGEGRWRKTGDEASSGSSIATDLYLRMFEIGVEADFADWASATVLLNSEWIGDSLHGGDGAVVVDEAHLDISVPRLPFYFVLGKRTQPFGLFEAHFVTDPLTQDAYETQTVGLSAGLKAPLATDLSLTFYKGRVQSDHLSASGLYDSAAAPIPAVAVARVDSWILSGISTPVRDIWTVFAAYSSEPGAGRRMTTLGLGSNLVIPGLRNLQIDAEYMRALRREDVPGLGRSFRETAVSVTASYQFILRQRTLRGGGNYRARKSYRMSHPAEIALRLEAFDDGSRASALGSWSVKSRAGLGGRYTFFEKGSFLAALELEVRKQAVRVSPAFEGTAPATHEVYLRLGLDF